MSALPRGPAARTSFLRNGAARLYVRDAGRGLPIIVLHGGPDFDHEYLLPDLDRLAGLYRLVYYDQRGRGRSYTGERPGDVTIATEIDDLNRVRMAVGSGPITLLGHSWGGLLAMEFAIRYPGLVSHLVLMNTAPVSHAGAVTLRQEVAARRSPALTRRMSALVSDAAYRAGDVAADAEYYRIHFSTAVRRPEQLDLVIRQLRLGFTVEGIVAARQIEEALYAQTWSRADYDLTNDLGRLQVPALVIHGESDFVPLDIARQVASAIPASRLVVLADCGHFAYLEQPDRVRSVITEFLTPS